MKYLYKWGLLAVMLSIVLSILVVGCGQKNMVAKINHRTITLDEYVDRLERTPDRQRNGQEVELGAVILDQMIQGELTLEMAEQQGVKPTDAQIDERLAARKKADPQEAKEIGLSDAEYRMQIAVEQAFFNMQTKGVKLGKNDVRDYYDKNQKNYAIPEQWVVRPLFVKNKADADMANDMLGKGISFETVAHQLQPQGAPSPSAQAVTKEGVSRLPGASEILKTPVGKWTSPIAFQKGYAIFLVDAHQPSRIRPFDDVAFQIRVGLMTQKGAERKNDVNGDYAKFRKASKIDISIDRYKQILLHNEQTGQQP